MLSYRKLAMRVLGRPLHTGRSDSPRPASHRAAAFLLTAAMLTSLTAPAFAETWFIENGDITISAGETEGTNKVSQGTTIVEDDTNTIIKNRDKDTASSNTVTIEAKDKDDKVEVTLDNVNIKTDSGSALTSEGDVTLTLKGDNSLTGGVSGSGSYGGRGIYSNGSLTITGGETDRLTAQGGSGTYDGGSGIYSDSRSIELSGSLELTAKAGSPNGKALSQNGSELDLNAIKEKLGPGAKVTTTDADGETKEVSIPGSVEPKPPVTPVEPEGPVIPEESSSSSDSGSSTPSAGGGSADASVQESVFPGLTVTDKDGQRISYTSTQSGNTLTVRVGRLTASFRISLAALRQLRAEGIETINFQTILCSTTLSVDELLAMGGEDSEAVLTHRLTVSSLTVG